MKPMRMPWSAGSMPHGALDILRGCNIRCQACYNALPPHIKPLSQIAQELDQLMACRRLHTLTITGGEATLHPDLCRIVQLVRSRNIKPALITNGLLLDNRMLTELKRAGMELIVVHVDPGQQRPDLPTDATPAQVNALRCHLGRQITAHGMSAGLVTTAYRSRMPELVELVRRVIHSPDIHFLMIANCSRISRLGALRGDLRLTIEGRPLAGTGDGLEAEVVEPAETMAWLKRELNLQPMAYIGSNLDPDDPRWITYLLAVTQANQAPATCHPVRSSWTERLAPHLIRWISGRFPVLQDQSPRLLGLQLLLNGMTGGDVLGNVRALGQALKSGRRLWAKHLLIQAPGGMTPDGRVVYCRDCPDATIREGRLVPTCLADHFEALPTPVKSPAATAPRSGPARPGASFNLAGPGDDAGIRALLRSSPMPGPVRLTLEREPSVLAAGRIEGDIYQAIVAREQPGDRVIGVGSRAVREVFFNGHPARLGYLGQLRRDPACLGRKKLLVEGFALCRDLRRPDELPFDLTSILADNHLARGVLTRGMRGLPVYEPWAKYVTLMLPIRRRPAALRLPRDVRLERAGEADWPAIAQCLERNLSRCQLAPRWTVEELRSDQRTPGLAAGDFWLAVRAQRIVGCVAVWDQRSFKQIRVQGYDRNLGRWRRALNLAAGLTGRPRLPAPGTELPLAYASHLAVDADDPAIFLALVRQTCRAARERGLDYLALGLADDHPLRNAARSLPHHELASILYLVHWGDGRDMIRQMDRRIAHVEVATL